MLAGKTQTPTSRALVVDDEMALRKLTVAALTAEGIQCDTAADGEEAWSRIRESSSNYQLVVSDLLMPKRHGHSLAVELLSLPERPLVVVLTGVLEPKLAKDLLMRGVDDIQFKPLNFSTFAAKMRCLIDRRKPLAAGATSTAAPAKAAVGVSRLT
jgi:DNA-binding response OmpR family regulator